MNQQKSVLGKGLASLLPNAVVVAPPAEASQMEPGAPVLSEASNRDRHPGISMASVEEIAVNPFQPRREFSDSAIAELAESMRSNGVIQPLIVRRTSNGYQLIAGERRLRAAKRAGLRQVPVVIRKATDREALELALIENIQRQDLNCVDEAMAYFQLLQNFSLTQEDVAHRVGKERVTVANSLRLLRLAEPILQDLKSGALSPGHGKALLGLDDPEQRLRLRSDILEQGLSVRETERRVQELRDQGRLGENRQTQESEPGAAGTAIRQRLDSMAQDLTRQWSTRVEVRGSERRGKIVFHYATRQDLDRILTAMQNQ